MNYLKTFALLLLIATISTSCEEDTPLEKAEMWKTDGLQAITIQSKLVDGAEYVIYKHKEGTGRTPYNGDLVCFAYSAFRKDGRALETTIDNEDICHSVDTRSIPILGLEEGIMLMSEGAEYTFVFPAELAYGESYAFNGALDPNSTIVYCIKLTSIN